MTLGDGDDEVIGMIAMTGSPDETVMVVSQNGYGKRSPLEDYRVTNRGGKGVKTLNITEKTGELVAIKNVNDSNDLMIRVMGRATQGVKLIDLTKRGDQIASVCKVDSDPIEELPAESEQNADNIVETNSNVVSEKTSSNDVENKISDSLFQFDDDISE